MSKEKDVILSSGEIYVLAGLLHFNVIFGIENKTLIEWQSDLNTFVKNTVCDLEKKNILTFQLNGKLFIEQRVIEMMKCLCDSDSFIAVNFNKCTREFRTVYFYIRNDSFLRISQNGESSYSFKLSDDSIVRDTMEKLLEKSVSDTHEILLLEDYLQIQKQATEFSIDSAQSSLLKCVSNKCNVKKLLKVMLHNAPSIELKVYKRHNSIYNMEKGYIICNTGNDKLLVTVDENGVISFDSLMPEAIVKQLQTVFNLNASEV